jgi:transposase-like protein
MERDTDKNSQATSGRQGETVIRSQEIEQLEQRVESDITSGMFFPGDRYLSVRELARRFHVSPVTAHRSIRALAKRGLLEVRGASGTFVGGAAVKSASRVQSVRVLMDGSMRLQQDFIRGGVQEGLLQSLPATSMELHFLPGTNLPGFLNEVCGRGDAGQHVLGSVLWRVPREVRLYFSQRKLPAVVIGHVEADVDLPWVDRDQKSIGRRVTEYVLAKGYDRLGLLMRRVWYPGDNLFVTGVQQVMAEKDLAATALQIQSVEESPALIQPLVREMLTGPQRRTALVCRTDQLAVESLTVARAMGVRIPAELAFVSVGTDGPLLQRSEPTITAMSYDDVTKGRLAGELLLATSRGEKPNHTYVELPSALIERQST